jgi:hypothetical protein
MYIYTFLLRTTDTVTSQNIVLSSWDILYTYSYHVRCVPCHHGMARPQVADGGDDLLIWRVVANLLNKQSRTPDKGLISGWGVG